MTKIQSPKRFEHLKIWILKNVSNFDIRISDLFFYLLILFLPTQLGRHFWPDFSSVSGIRVDYLAPTLYLTDILILLLFVVWVLSKKKFSIFNFSRQLRDPASAGQFSIKSKFKKFNIKNSFHPPVGRIKLQISFLLAIILIGIVFSKNQLAGLYGFIKLLEFIFLGFYTAYSFKKLRFDAVLLLFSIGIIFESFLAIFQYINQTSIDGIFYFLGERTFNSQTPGIANASVNGNLVLRPYGTFSHPNVLAGFLVIAMTILIFNFQFSIFNFRRILYVLTLLIGTITLFLTMSRVAIVLWLITVGLWFVKFSIFNFSRQLRDPASAGQFSIKSKFKNYNIVNSMKISNFNPFDKLRVDAERSRSIKFKIVIVIFIGAILLISPLQSRFTSIRLTDESIMQRAELVKSSYAMIKSHPVFGVGLNNFLVELPKVHKQDANVFYLQPVHNIYLLILTQTGIVGLAFFIWFILKTFKNLKIKNSFHPPVGRIKFQILLTVLFLGSFDHYFLTLQQGQLLFSFVLGLCWIKSRGNFS